MVSSTLNFDDLSIEEQNAVTALKSRMVDSMDKEMFEDLSVFVRFLRARNLNLNAAEVMLRNHIDWRRKNQVDTIITNYTPKEVCSKFATFSYVGIDKEGSPIMYFHFGSMDTRGILKSCRKIDVVKYIIQKLEIDVELLKKESIKRGKYIDKWTMFYNFENISFSVATHKQTLEILSSLIVMYEGNYPERLKVAYVINASIYFTMLFNAIKYVMSGPTIKKIKIFRGDGWKDEILNLIDADVLPAFLGGNRTDPDGDPLCKSIIVHGGPVPERYYLRKKETCIANFPDVKKVTVTRMSKVQVTLAVPESGSHIEWEFETKSRDIGFALLYKKNNYENQTKVVIPKQRIDTYTCSETGMYKCDIPGIYIIEFDNSYSWIFQKEIYYRVSITKTPLIQ